MSATLQHAGALHRSGNLPAAVAAYRGLLAREPSNADAWHYLGLALLQMGRAVEAMVPLERALQISPRRNETRALLALVLRDQGRFADAWHVVEPCLADPRVASSVLTIAGSVLLAAGENARACQMLERAVAGAGAASEAWHYLAVARHRLLDLAGADAAYLKAESASPGDPKLRYNHALLLEAMGRVDDALAGLQAARRLGAQGSAVLARLGHAQAQALQFEAFADTVVELEASLASRPPEPLDSDLVEPLVLTYFPLSDEARQEALRRYAVRVDAEFRPGHPVARRQHVRGERLRMVYLSPDLGSHAVGGLIAPVLAAHDAAVVDLSVVSLRRYQDPIAERIARDVPRFLDASSLSNAAIAQWLDDACPDVIIDLGGYTLGARPALLARRIAPVQLAYLGFLESTGSSHYSGFVADDELVPASMEGRFTEPVLRMPGSLLPIVPQTGHVADPPAPLARLLERRNGETFACSFNNSYKLDADLVADWAAILRAVAGLHLIAHAPVSSHQRLLQRLAGLGVDTDRVHLVDRIPLESMLGVMQACDLFLDSYRYQAGATAVAAAQVALPVLSRPGATPVARLGASVNSWLDNRECLVESRDAYIEAAVALLGNQGRLASLRNRLRDRVRSLAANEGERVARAIERLSIEQIDHLPKGAEGA